MPSNALKKINGTQQFKVKIKYDDGTSEIVNSYPDLKWNINNGAEVDPEGNVVCKNAGIHNLYASIGSVKSNTITWETKKSIVEVKIKTNPNQVLRIDGTKQKFEAEYIYDDESTELASNGIWEITSSDGGEAKLLKYIDSCEILPKKEGNFVLKFTSKENMNADPIEFFSAKYMTNFIIEQINKTKYSYDSSVAGKNIYYGIKVFYSDGSSEYVNENPDSKLLFSEIKASPARTLAQYNYEAFKYTYDPDNYDGDAEEADRKKISFIVKPNASFQSLYTGSTTPNNIEIKISYDGTPYNEIGSSPSSGTFIKRGI